MLECSISPFSMSPLAQCNRTPNLGTSMNTYSHTLSLQVVLTYSRFHTAESQTIAL